MVVNFPMMLWSEDNRRAFVLSFLWSLIQFQTFENEKWPEKGHKSQALQILNNTKWRKEWTTTHLEKVTSFIRIIITDGEVVDTGFLLGQIFQIYAIREQELIGKWLCKKN